MDNERHVLEDRGEKLTLEEVGLRFFPPIEPRAILKSHIRSGKSIEGKEHLPRLKAHKPGRNWFVFEKDLDDYLASKTS